ncbi:MAG: hypothetical protein IPM50_02750 [Acidobacteriota bacterium]|nr:MAG: hypothetical protein IPM50_02750 [Acidobacteriota bacterium]
MKIFVHMETAISCRSCRGILEFFRNFPPTGDRGNAGYDLEQYERDALGYFHHEGWMLKDNGDWWCGCTADVTPIRRAA